jgi:hypothetical protein
MRDSSDARLSNESDATAVLERVVLLGPVAGECPGHCRSRDRSRSRSVRDAPGRRPRINDGGGGPVDCDDGWRSGCTGAGVAPRSAPCEREIIGRLESGVGFAQAERALETVVRRIDVAYGEANRESDEPRVRVLPGGRMFPVRTEDLPRAIGFHWSSSRWCWSWRAGTWRT